MSTPEVPDAEAIAEVIYDDNRRQWGWPDYNEAITATLADLTAKYGRGVARDSVAYASNALSNGEAVARHWRGLLAEAWDEGHETPWKREPDDCECYAYSRNECGCGRYGMGRIITPNPYREETKP